MLPLDRRQKLHELATVFLNDLRRWKTTAGVESEFFLAIESELTSHLTQFSHAVDAFRTQRPLKPAEESIVAATYHKAAAIARRRSFQGLADILYVKEQDARLRYYLASRRPLKALGLILLRVSSHYGTSLFRFMIVLLAIILFFAITNASLLNYGTRPKSLVTSLYWSIITITTVGYGDVTPSDNPISLALAASEAFIGTVMFGVLLHLIIRRVRME